MEALQIQEIHGSQIESKIGKADTQNPGFQELEDECCTGWGCLKNR